MSTATLAPETPSPTAVAVTVYSKPRCVMCDATKRHLDKQGTPYELVDITVDTEARDRVAALGYLQAPVVIAGDMHWSGYSPDKCDKLGTLDTFAPDIAALDAEATAYLAEADINPAAALDDMWADA